jgi:Trehalose-phosphatase
MLSEHAARLAAQAQTAAVCLDFDGTLAPIVDDPNEARPLTGAVELLDHLAARFAAVALVGAGGCRTVREDRGPGRLLGRGGEGHCGQVHVSPSEVSVASKPCDIRPLCAARKLGTVIP